MVFERKEVARMPTPRPRPQLTDMYCSMLYRVSSQKTKYSEKPQVGRPKTMFEVSLGSKASKTWPTSLSFNLEGRLRHYQWDSVYLGCLLNYDFFFVGCLIKYWAFFFRCLSWKGFFLALKHEWRSLEWTPKCLRPEAWGLQHLESQKKVTCLLALWSIFNFIK